jgi:two-component sensor histidine kinase
MLRPFHAGIFLCLAISLLPAFTAEVHAQQADNARIDSLKKKIVSDPDDTAKIFTYIALSTHLMFRYAYQLHQPADSIGAFQATAGAIALSKKLKYPYGAGMSLLEEAKSFHQLQLRDLCQNRLEQAHTAFRAANNKSGLAATYIYKAYMLPLSDTASSKISWFDSAAQFAREVGDADKELLALKAIADIHQQQGRYDTTIRELQHILDRQKQINSKRMHFTTDLLAHCYMVKGKHKEALQYAIATLDHCRNSGDTTMIFTFYQRLGFVYSDLHNYDKALDYFHRALATASMEDELHVTNDIARCLIRQQKYQQALDFFTNRVKKLRNIDEQMQFAIDRNYMDLYYFMERYRDAEKYLLKIWAHPDELNRDQNEKSDFFASAGWVYYKLKQYDKARWYGDSASKLAREVHSWADMRESNYLLFQLDSMQGHYLTAIRHYQNYKHYSDSIQKDVSGKQVAELAVQYETDQKNTALELLNSKTLRQEDAIREGRFLRNTMIIGAALLLLLLLVIFSRYRLKQKANRLLEQKQQEKDKLLAEKEWLLKEIHHRVKNNLQIVMSLLNSQTAYIDNEPALTAIHDSQHRVHAMSLIHQKLYNTDNVSTIDMSFYIRELASYLAESFNTSQRIRFGYQIEPIDMDVSQAVPLGLIINEAITNAIKYAFPDDRHGMISISLARTAPDRCLLTISDNGIGIPPDHINKKTGSLGMTLMKGLSEDLEGSISIENNQGTVIQLSFPYERTTRRADASTASLASNN